MTRCHLATQVSTKLNRIIGAMGGMMIALNVMFQTGLGLSPLACAVATVAIPLLAIGGSITSSALLAKIGRTTMHIGIVVMAVGLVIVDLVLRSDSGGVTAWDLAGPLAVTGFGMGMVFVPMFDVILAGVAPHELGSASGLLEAIQQLAMSIGIAAVGTVLFDGSAAATVRWRSSARPTTRSWSRSGSWRPRARRCSGCPSTRASH